MKNIATILLCLIAAGCTPSPEAQAKADARGAISLCWENQAKKSNDPATARFVAGACEMMESDFKTKYGVSP